MRCGVVWCVARLGVCRLKTSPCVGSKKHPCVPAKRPSLLKASCNPRRRRLPKLRPASPAFLQPSASESVRTLQTQALTASTAFHEDVRMVSSRRDQLGTCSRGLLQTQQASSTLVVGRDLVSDTGLKGILQHFHLSFNSHVLLPLLCDSPTVDCSRNDFAGHSSKRDLRVPDRAPSRNHRCA